MDEHEKEREKEWQEGPAKWMEEARESGEVKDWLKQCDRFKWRDNPPKVLRGDMKEAFKAGAAADKMQCDCWNVKCPFYGDCRKCIVFHKALYQMPTCLRHMVSEVYLAGYMDEELHITDEERKAEREI